MTRLAFAPLVAWIALAAAQVPVDQRGLAPGAHVPAFEAIDQTGRARTFHDLAGPKGLVLLFVRSADW